MVSNQAKEACGTPLLAWAGLPEPRPFWQLLLHHSPLGHFLGWHILGPRTLQGTGHAGAASQITPPILTSLLSPTSVVRTGQL